MAIIGESLYQKGNNSKTEGKNESDCKIHDIANSFKELHIKIFANFALYYGHPCIGTLFETKTKIIGCPAQDTIQNMKSYIQGRMRQPTCFSNNEKFSQKVVDFINELIINIYSQNGIESTVMKAWTDYMISGIGIIKIEPSLNTLINHINITPTNCIWDISNHSQPQFFIHEEILSNNTIIERYGINAVKYNDIFSVRSNPIINLENFNFNQKVITFFTKGHGKEIKLNRLESIYSKEFKSTMVHEKPSIGFSVLRHEYYINNIKVDGSVKQKYRKYTYLNGIIINDNETLDIDQFPYIFICNPTNLNNELCFKYPSFLDKVKDMILDYNYISNIQRDARTINVQGSNKVFINTSCIEDGMNKDQNNLNDIIKVKLSPDVKINEVMYVSRPVDISQEANDSIIRNKIDIRKSSGLIDFDNNQIKSGYHESLRLGREFGVISNWLTDLDACLIKVGRSIYSFIKNYCDVDQFKLSMYTQNIDALESLHKVIEIFDEAGFTVVIKESEYSDSFKQNRINSYQTLKEITGEAFKIPVSVIAKSLDIPEETIELLENYNSPSEDEVNVGKIQVELASIEVLKKKIEVEKIKAEIGKIKSETIKDFATSLKILSEAKSINMDMKKSNANETF